MDTLEAPVSSPTIAKAFSLASWLSNIVSATPPRTAVCEALYVQPVASHGYRERHTPPPTSCAAFPASRMHILSHWGACIQKPDAFHQVPEGCVYTI